MRRRTQQMDHRSFSRKTLLTGAAFGFLGTLLWWSIAAAQATSDLADELSERSPYQNWELISAFLLPLVIAFLIKKAWNKGTKAVAAMAVSAVWVVIGLFVEGQFTADELTLDNFFFTLLKVAPLVFAFYEGLWKQVGTTDAIHKATG